MRKISQHKKLNEGPDPRMTSGEELTKKKEAPTQEPQPQPPVDNADAERQQAAEKGAEGSVDKNEKTKVHIFRFIGSNGDGLVFRKDRDEEKMNSENWQYLGEFSLPGGFVNQLPRNDDDTEWRVVHKN